MDINYFVEQYFMSKRFVLALVIIIAGVLHPEVISKEMIMAAIAFYFAAHVSSDVGGDVPAPVPAPVAPKV